MLPKPDKHKETRPRPFGNESGLTPAGNSAISRSAGLGCMHSHMDRGVGGLNQSYVALESGAPLVGGSFFFRTFLRSVSAEVQLAALGKAIL